MSDLALEAAMAELSSQLADGDLDLGTYTDAEMAAVTPDVPPYGRLVPLTTLDVLDDDDRLARVTRARMSLVERGLVVGDDRFEATDELAAILELRSNPSAIVIVDHMSRGGDDFSLYLYGIGSAGYLVERVTEDTHVFVARALAAIVGDLCATIDARHTAVSKDGPQLERRGEDAPQGWDALERAVQTTESITRLTCSRKIAVDSVEDTIVSFAAGKTGVWGYSGYGDETEAVMYARSLSRPSLEAALNAFLGAGQQAVSIPI